MEHLRDSAWSTKGSLLLLYSLSSSMMMVVNKMIMMHVHEAPITVVGVQNGLTIVFLLGLFHCVPDLKVTLEKDTAVKWAPVALTFVVMLVSSMKALEVVGVATIMVFRNLTVLSIAIIDTFYFNKPTSPSGWLCLLVMFIGSLVYARDDITFSIWGYLWTIGNCVITVINHVYAKHVMNQDGFSLSGFGMAYYNNVLSIPFLLVAALLMGGEDYMRVVDLVSKGPIDGRLAFGASTVLGFTLSLSSYALQKAVDVTIFAVASNFNKYLTILFNVLLVNDIYQEHALGLIITLAGGGLYSYVNIQKDKVKAWEESFPQLKTVVSIGYIVVLTVCGYYIMGPMAMSRMAGKESFLRNFMPDPHSGLKTASGLSTELSETVLTTLTDQATDGIATGSSNDSPGSSIESGRASIPENEAQPKHRVAICITGQLRTFGLDYSEINPNDGNAAQGVNAGNFGPFRERFDSCTEFTHLNPVAASIQEFVYGGLKAGGAEYDVFRVTENYHFRESMLIPQVAVRLGNGIFASRIQAEEPFNPAEFKAMSRYGYKDELRRQHYLRQIYDLKLCLEEVDRISQERGITYTHMMRLRPDIMWLQYIPPIDSLTFKDPSTGNPVVYVASKHYYCCGNDDWFNFGEVEPMRAYFSRFDRYAGNDNLANDIIKNIFFLKNETKADSDPVWTQGGHMSEDLAKFAVWDCCKARMDPNMAFIAIVTRPKSGEFQDKAKPIGYHHSKYFKVHPPPKTAVRDVITFEEDPNTPFQPKCREAFIP